jgi:CubicO group peptidase (beta-lactamase class C family)
MLVRSKKAVLGMVAAGAAMASGCAVPAPGGVSESRETRFRAKLSSFLDRLNRDPNAPPGAVVVVVHGKDTVFARAYGVRDAATGAPLNLDTPVYTASTTKSYVGLLAAELDRKRLLPLTTTLADVWPDLRLKAPLDPQRISAAQLLSHAARFTDSGLAFKSNSTGQYTLEEVPQHLARYGEALDKPFEYSNFGPFLYSMMVEKKLGIGWRDALSHHVLEPLRLRRTSARIEDFKSAEIARCHLRRSSRANWQPMPLKPTPLLNASGGIYASGRDSAAYLKAFTSSGRSSGGRIPASSADLTGRVFSQQEAERWGFRRSAYGLGWDIGTYGSHEVLVRAGGFPGCRALFAVYPTAKLAVGVLTVSEAGANSYNAAIAQQAIDIWTADPGAEAAAQRRISGFATEAAEAVAALDRAWKAIPTLPSMEMPNDLAGRYDSDRLGTFVVTRQGDRLLARMGEFRLSLTAVEPDKFYAFAANDPEPEVFTFVRDRERRPIRMMWDDRAFERVP